jgi:hypothetical protein
MDKEIYDRAMAESRAAAEEKERLETIFEESEEESDTKKESCKKGTKRSLGSTFQDDFVEKKEDLYDDDDQGKKSKKPRNK